MGLLTTSAAQRAVDTNGDPVADALLYVFAAGTESPRPIYVDWHLTLMQANPVRSDAAGYFPECYLLEGDYRVVVTTPKGEELFVQESLGIAAEAVDGANPIVVQGEFQGFGTLAALLSDAVLSYTPPDASFIEVTNGDYIRVTNGNFVYQVVNEAAITFDLQTAGGVKLIVVPGDNGLNAKAFGAVGDGITDDSAAMQTMIDAVERTAAAGYVPSGLYLAAGMIIDKPAEIFLDPRATLRQPANRNAVMFTILSSDVTITGGIFDADRANNANLAQGIQVTGAQDWVQILNARFENTQQDAIKWEGGNHFKVRNCRFVNCLNGSVQAIIRQTDAEGAADSEGFEITGNTSYSIQTENYFGHFKVRGNGPDGTKSIKGPRITNNTIVSPVAPISAHGIECNRNIVSATITDNTIIGGYIGMSLGSFLNLSDHLSATDVGFRNGVVSANTFIGQNQEAIELTTNSKYNTISGNTVRRGTGTMIRGILVNSPGCEHNLVAENVIEDADLYGISCENGASATKIIGNLVRAGSANDGIRLDNASFGNQVTGNTIHGENSAFVGVHVFDTSGVVVRENEIFDVTSNGVRITGSSSAVTISDIFVSGNRQDYEPVNFAILGQYTQGSRFEVRGTGARYHTTGNGPLSNLYDTLLLVTTGNNTHTLSDGVDGKEIFFLADNATNGTATITPASTLGFTSVRLNATGDSALLRFTAGRWTFVSGTATLL